MSNWPIFLHTIWFNFFRCLPHPELWTLRNRSRVASVPSHPMHLNKRRVYNRNGTHKT